MLIGAKYGQTQTNNPKEDTLTNVVYNETGNLGAIKGRTGNRL
jgi:hypothetical protein